MNESKYKELLKENIIRQWERFEYYRNLCKKRSRNLEDIKKAIENEEYYLIPGVAATAFKKSKGLFGEVNDFSLPGKFQVSSNTSGDPSYVYTTHEEVDKILDNYRATFGLEGISKALGFSPSIRILDALSRKSNFMGYKSLARMKFALDAAKLHYSDLTFTVDLDMWKMIPSLVFKGKPALKKIPLEEIINIIKVSENNHEKIAVGGFVLLMVPYLDQMKEGQFNFDDNLYITFSGGGYSGAKGSIRGQKVNKPELIKKICSVFGIDKKLLSTHFKDIYGFTESPATHEGFWNDKIGDYVFQTWHESRAYIVDPETEKPLKSGQGLLKFITPYANGIPSAANVSVLQFDLATIFNVKNDYQVTYFTQLARFQTSSVEGCAYKADEISKN